MSSKEELYNQIVDLLREIDLVNEKRKFEANPQPLDPDKPVPVMSLEYLDLLQKQVDLSKQLDKLLDEYRGQP